MGCIAPVNPQNSHNTALEAELTLQHSDTAPYPFVVQTLQTASAAVERSRLLSQAPYRLGGILERSVLRTVPGSSNGEAKGNLYSHAFELGLDGDRATASRGECRDLKGACCSDGSR